MFKMLTKDIKKLYSEIESITDEFLTGKKTMPVRHLACINNFIEFEYIFEVYTLLLIFLTGLVVYPLSSYNIYYVTFVYFYSFCIFSLLLNLTGLKWAINDISLGIYYRYNKKGIQYI